MTDKELDAFMGKVLLDAVAFDEDHIGEKSLTRHLYTTDIKCERC